MTTTQQPAVSHGTGAPVVPTPPVHPAPAAAEGERASGSRMGAGAPLPRAGRGAAARPSGTAPLKFNYSTLLQTVLFWAGAILMPTGVVVILLGYVGVANAAYDYDRQAFSYSGGFLGLGLTFLGGFLYFGAWLARIAADNREASNRLSDTLLILADVTSRAAEVAAPVEVAADLPVTTAGGTTRHRRDCALLANRGDLEPVGHRTGLVDCRVCKPD